MSKGALGVLAAFVTATFVAGAAFVALPLGDVAFCGSQGSGGSISSAGANVNAETGSARSNPGINQGVLEVTNNGLNNRKAAAMWVAAHLESGWDHGDVGAMSYGAWQIQNPADVPPVVHSGITSAQALDPVQAARYMSSAFDAALTKLELNFPGLWLSNPELAAEKTAYYAERPKYDYYQGQSAANVHNAWVDTLDVMKSRGVSTDFGQNVGAPAATVVQVGLAQPQPQGSGQGGAGCGTQFTAGGPVGQPGTVTGDAVTLARQILALPKDRIQYIFGADQDIQATAEGRLVTPGSGAGCPSRRPVALSAELLQVILNIARQYSITLGSMISSHDCDKGRHPLGRAVDINYINGVNITGTDTSFTGGNLQLYQEFMNYVASILPRGQWVNGQPVGMGGMGQQQCFGASRPELDGRNTFPDACNHLHVDVGVAAAPASV